MTKRILHMQIIEVVNYDFELLLQKWVIEQTRHEFRVVAIGPPNQIYSLPGHRFLPHRWLTFVAKYLFVIINYT